MSVPSAVYRPSLALLMDLYEVSMAYSYWKAGVHEREAVYHHYFRQSPFGGGYVVACGLEYVVDFLRHFRFTREDRDYLATLEGNDGKPMFEAAFLDYLLAMEFSCDIDAIPEGTVVFPPEPLIPCSARVLSSPRSLWCAGCCGAKQPTPIAPRIPWRECPGSRPTSSP